MRYWKRQKQSWRRVRNKEYLPGESGKSAALINFLHGRLLKCVEEEGEHYSSPNYV